MATAAIVPLRLVNTLLSLGTAYRIWEHQPSWVAAGASRAAFLLAGLVLRLGADDLLVQPVIEGALHAAHAHPFVCVFTGRQG